MECQTYAKETPMQCQNYAKAVEKSKISVVSLAFPCYTIKVRTAGESKNILMAEGNKMAFLKKRMPLVILLVSMLILMLAGVGFLFWMSENFNSAYGISAKNEGGVIDLTGNSFAEYRMISLAGEWEFFYNRWIVSDGDMGKPDGTVSLPGRWTGLTKDGKKLSGSGYASFRMQAINFEGRENELLRLASSNANVAYRMYINGVLAMENGVMDKTKKTVPVFSETGNLLAMEGKGVTSLPLKKGEPNEFVIEISFTGDGGFTSPVWLTSHVKSHQVVRSNSSSFIYRIFPIMLIGLLFMAFFLCAALPLPSLPKTHRLSLSLLMLALLVKFSFEKSAGVFTLEFLGLNGYFFPELRYVLGIVLMAANVFNLVSHKAISLNKREWAVLGTVNLAAIAAVFLLRNSQFVLIPMGVQFLSFFWLAYKIFKNAKAFPLYLAFLLIHCFISEIIVFSFMDDWSLFVYSMEDILTWGYLTVLIVTVILSFYIANETERLVDGYREIHAKSLRSQIKPHFIFNAMTAIQDVYETDAEKGKRALSAFSRHLRANVDSDLKRLIPFEEELENMLNFFDLENFRRKNKPTLVLDTEYTDFFVPPLSLQPFLENAIKYAYPDRKNTDAEIGISTFILHDKTVRIDIIDQGTGFDTQANFSGVGIKNATARLKYELDADVSIESAAGAGTKVTIVFKRRVNNENLGR